MSKPLRAVLFDVDGTLVDTNYLHVVTWWQAFAQGGHHVPMADIHRAIGMGSDQMLDRLLPADRDRDADSGLGASHDAPRRMLSETPKRQSGVIVEWQISRRGVCRAPDRRD
jgi:phosphoglycolate phosphatase-like HAD superfamily hydrolase